jgi:8-oxo-dGTP diphosphatase
MFDNYYIISCKRRLAVRLSAAMIKEAIVRMWTGIGPRARLVAIRATQQKFTVSAAAIVTNEAGELLLLRHLLRPQAGWGLPGGFMTAGEQPEDAIKRELLEEIGLELDQVRMLRVRTINRHIELLFRAFAAGEAKIRSREITDIGWFSQDDLPEMSPIQKRTIDELLKAEV